MLKRSKPVFTVVLTLASAALIASAGVYAQQGNSAGKGKGAEKAQTAWTAPGHVNAKGNGHPNHKGNGYGHGPHEGQEHDDSDGGKNKNTGKGKSKGKSGSSPDTPVVDVPEATDSCAIYYAGQYTVAGEVCLTIDGDIAYIDYNMVDGWKLSNPHLWVGDTLDSAPRAGNGNPIPGQFPFNASVSGVDQYTFVVPVSALGVNKDLLCGDESSLLVAAHGEVSKDGQHESAWAGETRFTEKGNWATYFGAVPDCGDSSAQACTMWQTSVTFEGSKIESKKLKYLSGTGDEQSGVNGASVELKVSAGREPGKISISASAVITAAGQTLTFAKLTADSTTLDEEDNRDNLSPEGDKIGFNNFEYSGNLPSTTATPLAMTLQLEVCEGESVKSTGPM